MLFSEKNPSSNRFQADCLSLVSLTPRQMIRLHIHELYKAMATELLDRHEFLGPFLRE